jgi:hypothetical protein
MQKLQASAAAIAALLSIALQSSALNLPPGPVTISARAGADSTFDFVLSDVPSGYDVGNNTYLGWCVELNNINNQTGDGRRATLLSTTSATLPAPYAGKAWDKINYLLNHKQGHWGDTQIALWYYTDGLAPNPDTHPFAVLMVQDAEAHGAGFAPGPNDVTAAAVVWTGVDASLQGSIIEVPPVTTPVCSDRFTAGGFIFRDGNKCNFGIQGGYQNGRLWGGINYIDHGTGMHVKGRTCTSYTVLDAECRRATYDVTIDGSPGTATVRICDYGEPGRDDVMEITLSTGYTAGIGTTLGGDGPGGGNVQLHKARCHKPTKPVKPTRPSNNGGNNGHGGNGNGNGRGKK